MTDILDRLFDRGYDLQETLHDAHTEIEQLRTDQRLLLGDYGNACERIGLSWWRRSLDGWEHHLGFEAEWDDEDDWPTRFPASPLEADHDR